jgi:hypothetical protein
VPRADQVSVRSGAAPPVAPVRRLRASYANILVPAAVVTVVRLEALS